MKPELQAKIDAAKARQKAADEKLLTKTATVVPDVVAELAGMKKTIGELEAANRSRPVAAPSVEVKPDSKSFSFARCIQKLMAGAKVTEAKGWEDAPNELHFVRQGVVERIGAKSWSEAETILASPLLCKALSLGNAAQIGGLIPVSLMSELIPLNRSQYILDQIGVRRMSGLKGNIEWNRQASGATFAWTGENPAANFTESDQTLVKINLSPKEAVGVTRLSNRLLNQDAAAIESFVRMDLSEGASRTEQIAYLRGTGIGGQPSGLLALPTGTGQANVNTASLAGSAGIAIQGFIALLSLIAEDGNAVGSQRIILHPNDWFDMLKAVRAEAASLPTVAVSGTTNAAAFLPLFSGDPSKGLPGTLHGYPVYITTDMTEGTALIGDFATTVIGQWAGMSLAISDVAENAFLRNQSLVRLIFDMDVAALQPSALATGTSLAI